MAEIDPRELPSHEATVDLSKEVPTVEKVAETPAKNADLHANVELEALKLKNLELTKQKEHWRDKYDRDIINKKEVNDEIPEDLMSDEGKALKGQLSSLQEKLAMMEQKEAISSLTNRFPAIADKMDEFLEFKDSYPGLEIEKLAKLFIFERNLEDTKKPRKGLEKPAGGAKTPVSTGYSQDDVKRLRVDSPRLYEKMLRSGQLDPNDIN